MPEKQVYLCANPACILGTPDNPGRFTDGMTAQQKHLLTGAPLESLKDGSDYGTGVCPNCGKPGKKE